MFNDIQAQIQHIKNSDPASRSSLEILLLYPSIHVMIIYRIAHQLHKQRRHGHLAHLSPVGSICQQGKDQVFHQILQRFYLRDLKMQVSGTLVVVA